MYNYASKMYIYSFPKMYIYSVKMNKYFFLFFSKKVLTNTKLYAKMNTEIKGNTQIKKKEINNERQRAIQGIY